MKKGKKAVKVFSAIVLAAAVTFVINGMTADAAGNEMTDTKTAAELGFSFTDVPVLDNSWSINKGFSVDYFGDGSVVHYCSMTCGFRDGASANYDYVQIPRNNGVATGISVKGTVTNASGVLNSTSSVTNNQSSTKAEVKHTGDNVTYSVTFIHP